MRILNLARAALRSSAALCWSCHAPSARLSPSPPLPAVTLEAAARSAPAAAPPAVTGGFVPSTIACGGKLCDLRREACCTFANGDGDGAYECAPRSEREEHPGFPAAAQIRDCQALSRFELEQMRLCDDSSDCASGGVCCAQAPGGQAGYSVCVPAGTDGANACDRFEACVDGQPCRTPDTECVAGRCERKGRQLDCDNARCTGHGEICCGIDGQFSCMTEPACASLPADPLSRVVYHCTGPASCPKGMYCRKTPQGSECIGMLDLTEGLLCNADRDCPRDVCELPGAHGKPRCRGVCVCQ